VDVLTQLAQAPRPRLVVDIGCGTGLSTRIWAGRADQVIGIEPNADMRRQAVEQTTSMPDISYREGLSTQTGLPDGCADIVTCCQSLHWMEPEPTFAEITHILRPGGVFAAVDNDWPPTIDWEVEAAYAALQKESRRLEQEHGCSPDVVRWPKLQHLSRMEACGRFRIVKEIVLHQVEWGTAERLIAMARSHGSVAAVLKHGFSEEEIGLAELRRVAQRLGDKPTNWYFSYRVRLGVK
jgi:SAM-dependent methyltransferase